MFGVGMPELMIIFVIALLVFGPKELPKIAKTIGKAMAELRRASDELRDGIQREIDIATRDEPETPAANQAAAPSTQIAEVTSSPSSAQASLEAEMQGGGSATVQGSEGGAEGGLVAREQGSPEVATATTPHPVGQADQSITTESPATAGALPESAEARVPQDESMKGVAQAAPAEGQPQPSPKPDTSPHAPDRPAETRNA
jgi:Tat protein translocase TatB subunit